MERTTPHSQGYIFSIKLVRESKFIVSPIKQLQLSSYNASVVKLIACWILTHVVCAKRSVHTPSVFKTSG